MHFHSFGILNGKKLFKIKDIHKTATIEIPERKNKWNSLYFRNKRMK